MPTFNPETDYYAILQVHPQAHQEVVKRAYRTILGLLHTHPDLGGSHEDAVRVNEAYQVLSDPETRKAYDAARQQRLATRMQAAVLAPSAGDKHGPQGASHSASRAEWYRQPSTTGKQTVYCPRCGARNRLPVRTLLQQARCGKCHASLAGERGNDRRQAHHLPAIPLNLTVRQLERLSAHGEMRVTRVHTLADGRFACLRCQYTWSDLDDRQQIPARCPQCHSPRWRQFRVFHCRCCAHQFYTADLAAWPYWLYPECPACHQPHWHADCEQHPLRWLFNQLAGVLRG